MRQRGRHDLADTERDRQVGRHGDKERSGQTVRRQGHTDRHIKTEGEGKEIISEKGAKDREGVSDRS